MTTTSVIVMEYDRLGDGLQAPMCWTTTASVVLDYECTSYLGYDLVCCVRVNNLGLTMWSTSVFRP